MTISIQDIRRSLLPVPRHMELGAGWLYVRPNLQIELRADDPRLSRTTERWRAQLGRMTPHVPHEQRADVIHGGLRITVDPGAAYTTSEATAQRDAYVLTVDSGGIELVGASPVGCAHGLTTLGQLIRAGAGLLPPCRLTDWPDFATRGVLLDITRGRVPALATLKSYLDRLASLKINQVQLNIEHAFVFSFDPAICDQDNGLTAADVRSLTAYARDRFIDLVPAVATFGHMGRILSMPRYRHLAEVEAVRCWEELTWPERMRGFTLDCMNPEAHRLVTRIWSDILQAFDSPVVNICGDEPHDLGHGKNPHLRESHEAVGVAYIDQIKRTYDICAGQRRRVQAWSDVVRNYPALFDRLPKDLVILHWGYDDAADYDGTQRFTEAGLETIVCPGTSGWKRIIHAIGLAERNIASFAAAGLRHGATGLLTTDWGDHGHFNLPACSWHGLALGAAHAWSAMSGGEAFDERFSRVMWSTDDITGISLLRRSAGVADNCETWRILWQPLAQMRNDAQLPDTDVAARAAHDAGRLVNWLDDLPADDGPSREDRAELIASARFTQLFAGKVAMARELNQTGSPSRSAMQDVDSWVTRMAAAREMYAACWRARYKPSGLEDILRTLSDIVADVHANCSQRKNPCR